GDALENVESGLPLDGICAHDGGFQVRIVGPAASRCSPGRMGDVSESAKAIQGPRSGSRGTVRPYRASLDQLVDMDTRRPTFLTTSVSLLLLATACASKPVV